MCFYSNTSGIDRAHSGIVKSVSGRNLITIEGNVSDRVKEMTREDWRTHSVGNTVVKGIGYRRIVSRTDFSPRSFYGVIDQNMTVDFILVHVSVVKKYQGIHLKLSPLTRRISPPARFISFDLAEISADAS